MVQNLTWESNSCLSSQEMPHFLCNPKVYYRDHKNLPPVSVLSQINPMQNIFLHSILRYEFIWNLLVKYAILLMNF